MDSYNVVLSMDISTISYIPIDTNITTTRIGFSWDNQYCFQFFDCEYWSMKDWNVEGLIITVFL